MLTECSTSTIEAMEVEVITDDTVIIVSMNGDKFKVAKKNICSSLWGSELVKTMVGIGNDGDDSEGSSDDEQEEIPLPNVNTRVLHKV